MALKKMHEKFSFLSTRLRHIKYPQPKLHSHVDLSVIRTAYDETTRTDLSTSEIQNPTAICHQSFRNVGNDSLE